MTPVPRQVVGIAPPGFRFPANARTEVIVPMRVPLPAPAIRKNGWMFAAARLKPGVSLEQADADLAALSRQMEQEHPGAERRIAVLRPAAAGRHDRRNAIALLLLLSAVGLVLLIACANVANLMVARVARPPPGDGGARRTRRRPAADRHAARSPRVWRSPAGRGRRAVVFAYWATPALVSLVPASVNLRRWPTSASTRGA